MPKTTIDVIRLLSSAAMLSKTADAYSPETYVIDLAELRQIIFDLQHDSESSDN
jgi:hypothetical protein